MSRPDQVQKLGGALGWGVVARVARMVLGLGGSVLVVRGLGAHDYGVLAVLRTTLAFVSIVVGGGLTQGLLRYLPAWRMMAGRDRIRRALISFVALQAALWLLTILLFWGLRSWIGGLSNETVAGLLGVDLSGTAPPRGDVDGDGAVTLADAVLVLRLLAGGPEGPAEGVLYEVDGDGRVGMAEALYVLQEAAGLRQ